MFIFVFFFFKQKTAYEIMPSLVGSEMCIRDRYEGMDPEMRTAVGYSTMRQYAFGVNITF